MFKRFLKVAMLLCVVALFLGALSLNTREAKANSSFWAASQGQFSHNARAPQITFPGGKFLSGVAAVSASDVWAVGYYIKLSAIGFVDQTLIEHWNGKQWSVVTSPNPGTTSNALGGIGAASASDIWAVGSSSNNTSSAQTLIEHWNGKQWSVVTSPNPAGSAFNGLSGIAVISASDIWAVGNSSNNISAQTLIEHWNGSQWSLIKSPNPGSFQNGLGGIAAVTTNDVWAVGSFSNNGNSAQTLVEHWNGTRWSVVTSPNPSGSTFSSLSGVAVVSGNANDIWAVGQAFIGSGEQTLIEHWNGKQWSIVTSPNPGQLNLLDGIAAVSSNDIWAVGQALVGPGGQTLIEHWNGKQWSVVASPNQPGSVNNFLVGIAVLSADDIWAVGGYQDSSLAGFTLTEHWNGKQWSIVTSPNMQTRLRSINDYHAVYLTKLAPRCAGQGNWIMAE